MTADRIKEILTKFFDGDTDKISLWYSTPNPSLGGASPDDMIANGKEEKLLNWMEEQLTINREAALAELTHIAQEDGDYDR